MMPPWRRPYPPWRRLLPSRRKLFPQLATAVPRLPRYSKSTQPNIFSEQQEQWLGDAMADQIERYFKPVQ